MTQIWVRYTLKEVLDTAIAYNLTDEEIYSAVFSEVNFKLVSDTEFITQVIRMLLLRACEIIITERERSE